MTTLTEKDIGRWVTYTAQGSGTQERGRIKDFSNEQQVAWVVYHANENWDGEHWKDYTAACTRYEDLDI